MKFTFATPDWQCAERCEKDRYVTVEADSEDAAREKAMNERWGLPPKFGLSKWSGQGLILEDRNK